MKKGKIVMTVTIGIACFILVMIIFMQFKVVHETDITSIDTMRQADLQTELANWKSKYEEIQKKYEETYKTLTKYKEETDSDAKVKKNLEEELENLQMILGKTDVQGKGIIVTIKEGNDSENKIDNENLLVIVNYLRDAGADAISINGQRIVNQTDFAEIRPGYIKVNSQRVTSPYEIKAIGDPDYLKSALIGTGGYQEELQAWGHSVEIEEKNKIEIPKYNGEMNTKYIEQ